MVTRKELINEDKVWLDQTIDDAMSDKFGVPSVYAKAAEPKIELLNSLIMSSLFGENPSGAPEEKPYSKYSYNDFNFSDVAEDLDKEKKRRQNLLDVYYAHLKDMDERFLNLRKKEDIKRLRFVMDTMKANPDIKQSFFGGPETKWGKHYSDLLMPPVPRKDVTPKPDVPTIAPGSPTVTPVFRSMSGFSTLASGVGGLVVGGVSSYLLSSASRGAICSVMGFAGLGGWTVFAPMIAAGALTAGKNIYNNRAAIGQSMEGKEGLGKVWAGTVAVVKSVRVGQVLTNMAVAGVGSLVGGVAGASLVDAAAVESCITEQFKGATDRVANFFDVDIVPEGAMDNLQSTLDNANAQNSALNSSVASLTADNTTLLADNTALLEKVDTMETRVAALESALAEPTSSLATLPASGAGAGVLNPTAPAIALDVSSDASSNATSGGPDAAAAVIVTDAAPTPEPKTIVVEAGDNLTNLVKEHYGVAEGSENFDKIMAEVAKANGMEGAEQNWLKINWELTLPVIEDPAAITLELDRELLDANVAAGDVMYSDTPKFAAPTPAP